MKEVSEKYPWVKWFQKDGNWYYRDKEGPLVKGLQSINGYKYYFNEDGVMQTGLQTIKGQVYYFKEQ
ncbi:MULTISPECIES: hypothetical protein [Bacillus cereus group]|uniref:hypothetical protein n=1 Tax=Bacillus cereus group TaxID=86661 RepID=UPI0009AF1422|nr:hypothetical protein [Bacillus cereus]